MSDNTRALIAKIEATYGKYARDAEGKSELKIDVGRFLLRRFADHQETLATVLDAIKESCPIRFGPPDVATIRGAIATYEADYGVRIAPPSETSDRPGPEEMASTRKETLVDLKAEAKAKGINTNANGWIAAYCFALMGKDQTEKPREES